MKLILIQGSLNPNSKTAKMVEYAFEHAKQKGADSEIIDLREIEMEFCDGRELKDYSQDLQDAYKKMEGADALIFGMPLYCYSVSGPLKNFIDITSYAMKGKIAGIMISAGGPNGFMSSADLMKILSYESQVQVIQPTAYAWAKDYDDSGEIQTPKVKEKIEGVVESVMKHC